MTILVERRADLTVEAAERIAFGRERVVLGEGLLGAVDAARAAMLTLLATGTRVYGINTGMGYLADRDLSHDEQRRHQRTLLLGRAVGSAPWLPPEEARAVMVARLASFLSGNAGVSPALCVYLADRLNDDFDPAIPASAIGGAGEVLPLAHAFQTFLGVGSVLGQGGEVVAAGAALAARGVAPYEPEEKEGVALLAGAPATTALALARRRAARVLTGQLRVAAAASVSALQAPLEPYDSALQRLDDDPLLAVVLADLRLMLGRVTPRPGSRQAPVSFRVIPQVLAHLDREVGRLDDDLRHALRTATDSPAFVDRRFLSNGGFHAVQLAADLDTVAAAYVRVTELAGQRVHRLLDRRFSGLPDQLTHEPGPYCGLVVVQKRVVGALNEIRRLAVPATVGLADTSLGQEDAMTFAFEAAAKLRRVEALVREVIACELLTARQAWALRGVDPPPFAAQFAEAVEPVGADRPLGPDIAALIDSLGSGAFMPPDQSAAPGKMKTRTA